MGFHSVFRTASSSGGGVRFEDEAPVGMGFQAYFEEGEYAVATVLRERPGMMALFFSPL